MAGEESGLVVHFKDLGFSSCGLGRISREEDHNLLHAVMKSLWLLCPEGEPRRQEGVPWPLMALVWVRMVLAWSRAVAAVKGSDSVNI